MPRYDEIFKGLGTRAIRQAILDVEAFAEQARIGKLNPERVQQLLLQDLDDAGPIFGKFFRGLGVAAQSSVMAAARAGELAGTISASEEMRKTADFFGEDGKEAIGSAIDQADPEALEEIEQRAGTIEFMWVAELVNTCHLCLPIHGSIRTLNEWQELGLHPDTIHVDAGFASSCHCQLVPQEQVERDPVVEPLARNKLKSPSGLKGSRRTARAVTQRDLEKSLIARDKAMETLEGRRTLRLLGVTGGEEGIEVPINQEG